MASQRNVCGKQTCAWTEAAEGAEETDSHGETEKRRRDPYGSSQYSTHIIRTHRMAQGRIPIDEALAIAIGFAKAR